MKKPVVLTIMDGFGYTPDVEGNAIALAGTPNLDALCKEYPHTLINASGLDVGLPDGQMGNSEVGHTNIGAGRVVYQDLTRITKAIEDGDFFTNKELVAAMENAKDKSLHILGLLSDGGVHSHINHLIALLDMAKKNGLKNVYVHAFTDGRDTDPQSAKSYVEKVQAHMDEIGTGKFASVSGRYYAMDRDKRWERVEKAYDAIVEAKGNTAESAIKCIEDSYAAGINDEFIVPTVILEGGKPVGKVNENDSVIFFNFRPDRAREITRALNDKDFTGFERKYPDVRYYCMRQYDATIDAPVIYVDKEIKNTLGEVLSKAGLKQLRTAETEKYAHVTFFFNGGVEVPFPGEDRKLVASPKVATYDLQPEMSACGVTEGIMEALNEDKYDVIIVNYANPDMVGHTGVFEAAVAAVKKVDKCIEKVSNKILEMGGTLLITADHGNVELMEDPVTHAPFTAHTTNEVPFILVSDKYKNAKLDDGKLSDIAPTMLDILGIEKPAEMNGKSLIEK